MSHKKSQRELSGTIVRIQPPARGPFGDVLDDDWTIVGVRDDDVMEIRHRPTSKTALLGVDHRYSYFTDPARTTTTETHGFLQLLVQVEFDLEQHVSVTPLPPPRIAAALPEPLDPDRAREVKRQYESFAQIHGAKRALHALLVAGDMSGYQLTLYVPGLGDEGLLLRISQNSNLIYRVSPIDALITSKMVVYGVNPTLRRALEKLIAQDPELKKR